MHAIFKIYAYFGNVNHSKANTAYLNYQCDTTIIEVGVRVAFASGKTGFQPGQCIWIGRDTGGDNVNFIWIGLCLIVELLGTVELKIQISDVDNGHGNGVIHRRYKSTTPSSVNTRIDGDLAVVKPAGEVVLLSIEAHSRMASSLVGVPHKA